MVLPVQGELSAAEHDQAEQVATHYQRSTPIVVDIAIDSKDFALRLGSVELKLNSTHVFGKDDRHRVMMPPIHLPSRLLMHVPIRFLARVRNVPDELRYPLDDGEIRRLDE